MKCLNCDADFIPLSVTQKYCCEKCGNEYRRKNKGKIFYPSITFTCAKCKRTVTTEEGSGDKRTRFCSQSCEKKYWKKPHWEHTSSRINFRSVKEYEYYEKRTNEM